MLALLIRLGADTGLQFDPEDYPMALMFDEGRLLQYLRDTLPPKSEPPESLADADLDHVVRAMLRWYTLDPSQVLIWLGNDGVPAAWRVAALSKDWQPLSEETANLALSRLLQIRESMLSALQIDPAPNAGS